jgi:hypothetical protein
LFFQYVHAWVASAGGLLAAACHFPPVPSFLAHHHDFLFLYSYVLVVVQNLCVSLFLWAGVSGPRGMTRTMPAAMVVGCQLVQATRGWKGQAGVLCCSFPCPSLPPA